MQIKITIRYHSTIINTSSKDQRYCKEGLGEIPHSQLWLICKLSYFLQKIVRCASVLKRGSLLPYIQEFHCWACFQKKSNQYITSENLDQSFHNSQEMAETNVSINGRIEKDNLVHRYHRILYNHKSWTLVICKIMNGTRSYQVRQVRHRKTIHISTHIWDCPGGMWIRKMQYVHTMELLQQ